MVAPPPPRHHLPGDPGDPGGGDAYTPRMVAARGGRVPPALRHALRGPYIATRYGGRRYWCPVCSRHFRRLAPYNGVPGSACPNCGARQRHRMLWLYLQREVAVAERPLRVLHTSPELGLGSRLRALPNLDYVSMDIGRGAVSLFGDLGRLPLRDASFDLVVSSHVLEHVADDTASMEEICRVLRPGSGQALVMVPVDHGRADTYEDASITTPEGRRAAFGQRDHVRLYGRDVTSRLAVGGLTVDAVDYAAELPADVAESASLRAGTDLIYRFRRP